MTPLRSHAAHVRTAACLLALGACAAGDTPVRIGVAGPLEQARGESMRLAAELAADEINRNGGIGGRTLELVFKNDAAEAERAVQVARELYEDETVVAVVGHLTSGTTLASAPVYNGGESPLVEISPSASNPQISDAGPYTFRICPTDLLHGARLAEWAVRQLRASRAVVLYRNDDYGRGVGAIFATHFRDLGGEIVAEDPYLDDLPSFEPYLRRAVQRGGVDVVMIAGTRTGAERILPEISTVGLRAAVMGGDGISGIEGASVDAEGVLVSTAYLPDRPGPRNAAFVQAYREAYGGREPDHRGAGAYDIVHLLARVIAEVGPQRQRIRDYLAGVGTSSDPFVGVTGQVAFDERGDVPDKDVVIGVVRAGRLVTAVGR